MLQNHFYTLTNPNAIEGTNFRTEINLNSKHPIFKGHFPGLPVVPGVCMMAIVKELLQKGVGKKLLLQKADTIKFLALINPNEHPSVDVEIKYVSNDDGTYSTDAVIFADNRPYFKMSKAVYR
jgi:3-hydroxyacyl-[acyl-carrier-protein] dehydratase